MRQRRLVVLAWLGLLVLASVGARIAGTAYSNSMALPGTDSNRATQLLEAFSPRVSGDTEQLVFSSADGALVTHPAIRARIDTMLARIGRLPHVSSIVSPYGALGRYQVNANATVAFAAVTFDRPVDKLSTSLANSFVRTAQSADSSDVRVAVAGQLAELTNKPLLGGAGLGIALAGIVLLLVFGSIYAMALPLASALVALGTAVSIVGLLSHVMQVAQASTQFVFLIGLGVGVDYALFIVTRHRQGLLAGRDTEPAIVEAVSTSGRTVLFAGVIVCIALLGIFALGVGFLYGPAVSAALGVGLTMLAALTLIPALLGFIGPRVMSRRQRDDLAANGPRIVGTGSTGFWSRWAQLITSRPAALGGVAFALVAVLALPFLSLRLGFSDQGNDPAGTTTRQAYDMLTTGFGPGFNGPLQLVSVLRGPANHAAFGRLVAALPTELDVASVSSPRLIPDDQGSEVALVDVYPQRAPQDAATSSLVHHLRGQAVPQALGGSGPRVYIGGPTASTVDFTQVVSTKLPLFIGVVVLLSLMLLVVIFRSLVVPLVSAVMNLLTVGAALGILVAVFQWGWLGSVFGVDRAGPVEAYFPVFLFAVLFGLSTDYQVFLVARIHEEYVKAGDNALAVRRGLAATGKTITAAALIMILVFGSFILGGGRVIKEFGVFLAGGILIDAVMIRMAIVPAVLLLTGRSNWWFPRVLDRRLPPIGFASAVAQERAALVAATSSLPSERRE